MVTAGIIRKVDKLGKVSLPKEFRNKAGIKEGMFVEIFATSDRILLRRYPAADEEKEKENDC